jgi:predicted nucleic acid-binding protein
MKLLDSNIIVYSAYPEYSYLRSLVDNENLKLGDALIAATALIYDLELNTRNLKDFESIPEIRLHNPIQEK